jgi:tape measure domain-containing protein
MGMGLELDNSLYYRARIDFKTLQRDIAEVKNQVQGMGLSVEKQGSMMDSAFKKMGITIATYFSVQQIRGFIDELISVRGEFQMLDVAFSTILKSKEKADNLMAQMVKLAVETPFELKDVAGGAKQLLAYGFEAEKVTDTITMLGNVASGVSAPLNDVIYLYGTLQTQGRAYTKDIMQFTGRGIPIIAELAKQFGVASSEIQKMVENGKIGFAEVEKAFKSMTGAGGMFENLMEKQAKTLPGLTSNMKDAWTQLFNELGKDTEGFFAGVIAGMTKMINTLKTEVENLRLVSESQNITKGEKAGLLGKKFFMSWRQDREEYARIAKEEADIEKQSKILFDDYVAKFENTIKKFTSISEASEFADSQYFGLLKSYEEAQNSHYNRGTKATKTVFSELQKEILYFKDLRKNQETTLGKLIFPDAGKGVTSEGDKVDDYSNTIKGLRNEMEKLTESINETKFSDNFESELAVKFAKLKQLQQQIDNLLNPVNRGEFDFLDSKIPPLPINLDPKKASSVQKGTITPLNEENYVKDLNITKDYNRKKQISYKALFDSIDDLGRAALIKRLNQLRIELNATTTDAEEKIRIQQQIQDVTDALGDKAIKNVQMISDALIELGNLAEGKVGEQIAKAGSGLADIVQGYASGNYVQAASGFFKMMSGVADLVQGTSQAEENRAKTLEKQAEWLRYMSNELQKQVNLTKELQGMDVYSGYKKSIEQTIRDISELEEKTKGVFKIAYGKNNVPWSNKDLEKMFNDPKTIEEIRKAVEEANKNAGKTKITVAGITSDGFINKDTLAMLNDYIDQIDAAKEQVKELQNAYNETITGSTYEGILSSIKDAFSDGKMSVEEMGKFTEDVFKEAIMKSFELEFLQKQMQNWYDAFAEANKDGKLTAEERTKLSRDFQEKMDAANEGLKLMSETLGIDLNDPSKNTSNMIGSYKNLSEETGGKIEGAFNGVRISNLQILAIAQKKLEKLDQIEKHTYTLYEIRDLIKRGQSNQVINDRANGW